MDFKFATEDQLPELASLVREYCKENNLEPNNELINHYISTFFKLGKTLIAVVEDRIVGVLCYAVMPHHFTGDLIMKKLCWYVTPTHRRGLGMKILEVAEKHAKDAGALVSFVSVDHKMRMPVEYRAYETEYIKIL